MFEFEILPNVVDAAVEAAGKNRGIYEYKFSCHPNREHVTLLTRIQCINCFTVWNHTVDFDRQLHPEWFSSKCVSSVLKGMPLHCLIGQDGRNVLTIAVSDVKNRVEIKSGLHEEDATITCKVVFYPPVDQHEIYEAIIRLDTRQMPYYDCIYNASEWWERYGYGCAYVPDNAKRPMYSTWYSFHQALTPEEIVQECRLAKALGMDTIILDDGWQTENMQRGYAYCGDWEPVRSKIGNMEELVKMVHAMDMKLILWYNIAFMGECAKNVDVFDGMYMDAGVRGRYTFDPRFHKVRTYLTELLVNAVNDWHLDGVKIDFVDSFIRSEDDTVSRDMDFPVLEEAVEQLVKGISDTLHRLNPEIMIEFRQNYIGPIMRKYANIFRVADCPNDAIRNRLGVINLRLTSGTCAVHSDMLMWNYDEPVETAAKQIINILFSVPQVSVRIERLCPEHYQMLQFYLSFWQKYRTLFVERPIAAECPEANYSKVCAIYNQTQIFVCYSDNIVQLCGAEQFVVVNGTAKETFYIDSSIQLAYTIRDCMGQIVRCGETKAPIFVCQIPVSGVAEFCRLS